jgi:hypothetical protein
VSNHYSAANLRFPGDGARLDFTDLYVCLKPHDDVTAEFPYLGAPNRYPAG